MTSFRHLTRLAAGALALLSLASFAGAIQRHESDLAPGGQSLLAARPLAIVDINEGMSAEWADSDPGWQAFLHEHPGTWHPRFDQRAGRLSFAWGSGIEWLPPGARVATAKDRAHVLDLLEQRARVFMSANAGIYRLPAGVDVVLDDASSGELDNGRVWYLRFAARVNGVPVDGTIASFNLNSGRLVQFGLGAITDALGNAPTAPRLTADDTALLARQALGKALGSEAAKAVINEVGEARLALLPVTLAEPAPTGERFGHRLIWEQIFRVVGRLETWTTIHDAMSGERLALFDSNRYACPPPAQPQGRVMGGVFLGPIETSPEVLRPMLFAAVQNGSAKVADLNGIFPFSVGSVANTTLSGQFFDLNCQGCSNPSQAFAESLGWGVLSLGLGGDNATANGFSTKAERNCFYHLNRVRQLAAAQLTDAQANGYFSRNTPAVVNINDSCNAFWDGNAVNFFRAAGGCNNTGEIADVMQHEWGHGLDQFTGGGGDGARGEGFSDVVAFLSTHDPNLGPFFFQGNGAGIRNADESVAGLKTRTNITGACPSVGGGGDGPLGTEVHCEGELHSQTWWHLARNLRTKYGETAGWYATERLFFKHMPIAHWSVYAGVPAGETVQYDGVVLIDDDNGNPTDGTPNGAEIDDAFTHHEIAGTPLVGDSPECTPPVAPTITLASQLLSASSGLWQVRVSWPSNASAAQYAVYRNDTGPTGSFVQVAAILPPVTEFLDDNVTDGVTYNYRLGVFDAAGCVSTNDTTQPITVTPLVSLGLAALALDDSGASANFNAIAEPGETLTLIPSIVNSSGTLATAVQATLATTEPGVTILDGSATVGDIAGGATIPTQAPHFSVRLDPALVSCGQVLAFTIEMESAEGCSVSGFTITTGRPGPFIPAWQDDFESDLGWARIPPPGGQATAATGLWVRVDPNPTSTLSQLGDDHTADPGVFAWVTGNDPDPTPRTDDVDTGCTTLLSPIIDLAGQSGLTLQYWRFYDIERALDDQLVFEISPDAGANWMPLESLAVPTQPFQQASFSLDSVLGAPAGQIRLRVTACDEGQGSLLEAMLDDVRIGRATVICEAPAARPRLLYAGHVVADGTVLGGIGNSSGIADPGETIRLAVDLDNRGNATATVVQGTVAITSAPAGVTLSDASAPWPDIAPASTLTSAGAPPHFELRLDNTVTCGARIVLALHVDYRGPAGAHSLDQEITLDVGGDVELNVFIDDFEVGDDGVTHGATAGADDWMRLPPSGTSGYDPPSAHGGRRVWANDVGGLINGNNYDGNYEPDSANWLETPPIDCTGWIGVKLGFWRWLSLEADNFDFGRILVNGTEIWATGAQPGPFLDTAWTWVEYDISAIADNNPSVVVRFELTSDGGLEFGGWNIDDLRLFTRDRRCGGDACNAPATPSPTGGWLRPTGANYGQNSVEFTWPGENLPVGETFVLERTSGLRPAPTWVDVTSGAPSFQTLQDASAPNSLYFYRLVRENCAGQRAP